MPQGGHGDPQQECMKLGGLASAQQQVQTGHSRPQIVVEYRRGGIETSGQSGSLGHE